MMVAPIKTGLVFNGLSILVLFLNGAAFSAIAIVISFIAKNYADVPRFSTLLIVEDGKAYAELEWSSTYYDYMKVGGETYLRLNNEGYSTFQIPITALDEPMVVIGDTTAMSVAHEIEYRLTFHTDEITRGCRINEK